MFRKIRAIDKFALAVIASIILIISGIWFDKIWLVMIGWFVFAVCVAQALIFFYQCFRDARKLDDDPTDPFSARHH